jgi:hypothetical protein
VLVAVVVEQKESSPARDRSSNNSTSRNQVDVEQGEVDRRYVAIDLHRKRSLIVRERVTKAGSPLVRWAAVEAISHMRGGPKLKHDYRRIGERRGVNIARVAIARKLLTLVYYGLRDGQIRCAAHRQATPP